MYLQMDLIISTDAIKILTAFLQKWKANPQVHTELQGAPNSQNNIEKEEQNWRTHFFQFQNISQS